MTMKRVSVLFLAGILIPFTVMAQAPGIGRIAIYADSFRTSCGVEVPVPYIPFDIYIFCQPSENGMYCAEFALSSSTGSMVIAGTDWHPGLSVVLGALASGVSACFLECQTDWVCIVRAAMITTQEGVDGIDIVRHPDVGCYQFASCLPDSPIEPVFFGPRLYVNSTCTPDTDPPAPISVDLEDDMRMTLYFDEKVFEPDAEDLSKYLLYSMDERQDTIPVNFAVLRPEEDRVWMVLGEHLWDAQFRIETPGMRDIAGNPAPPGNYLEFRGFDIEPPSVETVYAPGDSSVVIVFSEMVTETSAENLSNYSFDCSGLGCAGTPQPVSAELQPDGRTVVMTFYSPLAQYASYEITIVSISDLTGNVMDGSVEWAFAPPDIAPPYIDETSMPADTSLMIHWNETVDSVTAVDPSNYAFFDDGPPPEPMEIKSIYYNTGRWIRLSFEPAADPEGEYTLYISGVTDLSANLMSPDTLHIIPLDTIPPILVDAGAPGLMDIELTFSEPVDPAMTGSESLFQIYPVGDPGTLLDIDHISCFLDCSILRIHLTAEMAEGGEYTVRANNIRDLAGNSLPSQQRNFTCYDVYPPRIETIFLSDLTHVNIQFSEPVNEAAGETESYLLQEEGDSAASIPIASSDLFDGETRAVLTTGSPLVHEETYTLRMSGVGDLLGNMVDPDTSWTFIADDTVDPVLISVTVTSDSLVHLGFSEPLDFMTAENVARYAVVETGDTSVRLTLRSASLDFVGMRVDIAIDGHGKTGTSYAVLIMGVTDISGNALYVSSGSFQFIDDIPPRVLSAAGLSTRHVMVNFSEIVTDASAGDTLNYRLYPAGDPQSEIGISSAGRKPDGMAVDLVLYEDLLNGGDYTLEVSGIIDLAGLTMEPAAIDFNFLDIYPPAIISVTPLGAASVSIVFSEPVDSSTARDTGNYSVYLSSDPSQETGVTSADWMTDEVRLDLASDIIANVDYTVRVDGVEDRFGNPCADLEATLRRVISVSAAKMALYIDEARTTNELETEVLHELYSFYVFVEAGGNGVFAVEYALSWPETYIWIGNEANPAWVDSELGNPYDGHSVALSMCADDWFWVTRVDCFCLLPGEQEIVFIRAHPGATSVRVSSCLPGHPMETVGYTIPLLINVEYVGVMVESWNASFRNGCVELSWSIREIEPAPVFEVSRAMEGSGSWQRLPSGLIRGDRLDFTMIDGSFEPGRSYRYRVESIEDDGRKILFETDAVATPVMPLTLRQNSPNPFNPSTSIGFYLPRPGNVRLEIFDVNGRLVDLLADGQFAAGEHSVDWDGRDRAGSMATSGVYFYRLTAGKESLSRKMVLLR
jgi:hypothetical protein